MSAFAALTLLAALGLYDQAVARALERRFANVSYVLIDVRSREPLAVRWADAGRPVAAGSLVKPFVAMAAPAAISRRCEPARCWLRRGHGDLAIEDAIAQSCNSYFLRHAHTAGSDAIAAAAERYGFPAPPLHAGAAAHIGLDGAWQAGPLSIARAYAALLQSPEGALVRTAMRRAAREGTAQRVARDVYAKTGTAACSHSRPGAGDGLVVAAFPPDAPRYVLLLRVHNTTGAVAAATAGAMIEVISHGR